LLLKTDGQTMLRDEEKWQAGVEAQKGEEYGLAVFRYAQQWAILMQLEIQNGKTIPEVAKETSHEADIEGITGFMYGYAVGILSDCWRYGEELRKWHNIHTQIINEGEKANDSGGVLNPAILSISV
jgi:hypothetical protein